jgi:hypothetical protein
VLEIIVSVLGAFGGAAAVGAVVAKFVSDHVSKEWLQRQKSQLDTVLETHKASLSRETEAHKLTLKRQEMLYAREVAAADALMKLCRRIYPKYSRPDMDWHDAGEAVACRLEVVEREAEDFLEEHSPIVSDEVLRLVEEIKASAADAKFYVQERDGEADPQSIEVGQNIMTKLGEAKDQIRKDLRR